MNQMSYITEFGYDLLYLLMCHGQCSATENNCDKQDINMFIDCL
jgi:hypothetical protein